VLSDALDKIIATTTHILHKEIAKNIKSKINHLEIGTKAPSLFIKNKTRIFDIEDFKGKYLYVSFFRGWDIDFEKELKIINYLKDRYEDDLDVVCISTDIDIKTYNDFIARQDESNFIYHYNFDIQILIDYRIPDFRMQETHQWQKPSSHVLIDPKGSIVYNHAKSPSKGFEYDFRLLIGK
jgi:peroxiredoxin